MYCIYGGYKSGQCGQFNRMPIPILIITDLGTVTSWLLFCLCIVGCVVNGMLSVHHIYLFIY